ncbi:MAG: glycosyltransferase [Patescibacteria group bacterium]|nr:glycosyltransferase [Patescibacteria group bacterium]
MRQLKIIQTPVRYYPAIGGVENYVRSLSHQLVQRGHQVSVVCADEPPSSCANDHGVQVKRLKFIGKIANTNITPFLLFSLLREDANIIHTYMPTPWSADISHIASRIKKTPFVISYFNDISGVTPFTQWIAHRYHDYVLPHLLRCASKIIVSSDDYVERSRILSRFTDSLVIIPPGVDTHRFTPSKQKKNGTIFFLSVLDAYHRYKGLDVLLNAVEFLVKQRKMNLTLLVGGEGDLRMFYERRVRDQGIKHYVKFLGKISDHELPTYFQTSSVFVLPSIGKEEGFGMVVLEALSCQTPVIVSEYVGTAKDVERSDSGMVVPVNDSQSLGLAIESLLRNPKKAEAMGKNGRKLVNTLYAWEVIASRIESVYESCLCE